MQKLNLNNISEAPENKDFWVVGTANKEGSIDSNSYKKNLGAIATKANSSSYYVDTYPQNPKEGDIITFTDDTPSKEYVNGEWKDRSTEGSGLPQITLLQVPEYGGQITIGEYISKDDLAKLEESGVAVAKYEDSNYVVVGEYDLNMASSSAEANFAFYGPTGLKFIIKHSGSFTAPWTVEMVPFAPRIRRSAPSDNFNLTSIGFTPDVLNRIFSGEITRLAILAGGDVPQIFTIARVMNSFGDWEVEIAGNKRFTKLIYSYVNGVGKIITEYPADS